MKKDNSEDIIKRVKLYKKEIIAMDDLVTLHLSDRSKYGAPGHDRLIAEIRSFEYEHLRHASKQAKAWLDNLLTSLLIYERLWRSAFEIEHQNYLESRSEKKRSSF